MDNGANELNYPISILVLLQKGESEKNTQISRSIFCLSVNHSFTLLNGHLHNQPFKQTNCCKT